MVFYHQGFFYAVVKLDLCVKITIWTKKFQKLKMDKRNLVDSVISVDRNIGKTLTYADLQDIFTLD